MNPVSSLHSHSSRPHNSRTPGKVSSRSSISSQPSQQHHPQQPLQQKAASTMQHHRLHLPARAPPGSLCSSTRLQQRWSYNCSNSNVDGRSPSSNSGDGSSNNGNCSSSSISNNRNSPTSPQQQQQRRRQSNSPSKMRKFSSLVVSLEIHSASFSTAYPIPRESRMNHHSTDGTSFLKS